MNTIFKFIFSVLAGFALAIGVIVWTQLAVVGGETLGFTIWTYRYYVVCLALSLVMITVSSEARKRWAFLGVFGVALFMVISVGFNTTVDSGTSGDLGEKLTEQMTQISLMLAKFVMYVGPGATAALYLLAGYEDVKTKHLQARS